MDFVVNVLWLARDRHTREMDGVCSGRERFRPRTPPRPLEMESPCRLGKPLRRQAA